MQNSANIHLDAIKLSRASHAIDEEGDVMERRHFLKIAFGFAAGAAGAAALAASAQAAPLAPQLLDNSGRLPPADVRPAVTSAEEANSLKPEPVRWGHHWHRHWHRRHWGWRHRHWHRRHW